MSNSSLPILIVGGGPTGLSAGLELARRGVPCRIVERRAGPSPLSRAVGIMPNTLRLLDPAGVGEAIRERAVRVSMLEIYVRGTLAFDMPLDRHDDPDMTLHCLPQNETESILAARAGELGVEVEYDTTLETLEDHGGHVSATTNGETRDYRLVLAADGANSTVRRTVGLEADGYDLDEEWSIADVEAPDWSDEPGVFRVYIQDPDDPADDANVIVFVIPVSPTRYRLVATRPDALAALNVDVPVTKVYREDSFRIGVRQVPTYRKGNIFLAGDAAHQHSPVGGRGMNLGIADAVAFANGVADGTLDGYADQRHRVGADTIEYTERVRGIISRPMTHFRKRMLQLLDVAALFPGVSAKITEQMVSGEF